VRCSRVHRSGRKPDASHNRAVGLGLSVRVLALALLFASVASPQILETTIVLPDTLGPLNGPYHLAWDSDHAHLRLYIGSEQGDIIVADAGSYRRLARIPVSPVYALCYVSRYGKVYGANRYKDSVTVIDGLSNQVIKRIKVPSRPCALVYNHLNDRLYCGGSSIAVIDCAQDTVVRTIAAPAATFAFDSTHNKLAAGASGALTVIDCERDSIVAVVDRVRGATKTLCYNPTAEKVYAALGDTLFAVDVHSDSVIGQLVFPGLTPSLACDPQTNRVYCWSRNPTLLHAVDCAGDVSIYQKQILDGTIDLACDPVRDKVVYTVYWGAYILDGSTGLLIADLPVDGERPVPLHSPGLDRMFCVPDSQVLFAISCADDSVVGGIPMAFWPHRFCLDTALDKLYFSGGGRAIGAADCARHVVTSYLWQCDGPQWMASNPNGNKLYVSCNEDSSVVVFDGTADTVLKSIQIGGRVLPMVVYPARNKLYVFASNEGAFWIDVIDCDSDTVMRRVALPSNYPMAQLLVPESDRLWSLHDAGFTLIDTKYDSVVADTVTPGWHNLEAACAVPEERKVYRAGRDRLYMIDMDNSTHIESLPRPDVSYHYLYCAASAHKLYWACSNDVGKPDSVYVIDTRTDSVVSRFLGASSTSGICSDRTGDYIYCSGSTDTLFYTIDTRTDSVVNRTRVPRNLQGFACNQRTHRLYCFPSLLDYVGIPVIFDSAGIGLCEVQAQSAGRVPYLTIVNRSVPFRSTTDARLFDASGRRVATLRPGLNDIGDLTPGVYFECEERLAASLKSQGVRKVVIAR
jgi:YVTN family beta-propeller protein